MRYPNLLQLVIFLCCVTWQIQASSQEVYKVVDENGNITYTDNPRGDKNAQAVELKSTNTQPAIKPTPKTLPVQTETKAKTAYSLAITTPANETHLMPGQWDLSVTVDIEPQLAATHFIQLLDNGSPIGNPQKDNSFTITNITRGAHELQARIVSDKGAPLKVSEKINVYVHRANANK